MDAESFTKLALRVLAGEATEGERRTLDALVSEDPSWQAEFEQIRVTVDVLRTTAPMAEAAGATEPELPAYRLNELRTAVRQQFGPVAERAKVSVSPGFWIPVWRRIFAGGGAMAVAAVVIFLTCANRTIEVGYYRADQVRGANVSLIPAGLSQGQVLLRPFDEDASFDQWQHSLSWTQHAKVWVDNETNLLHILTRDAQGKVAERTEPLARTDQQQSGQIKQAIETLEK